MSQIVEEEYSCETCCVCAVKFWMPTVLREIAVMRGEDFLFYCPNGHAQYLERAGEPEKPSGEVVRFEVVK